MNKYSEKIKGLKNNRFNFYEKITSKKLLKIDLKMQVSYLEGKIIGIDSQIASKDSALDRLLQLEKEFDSINRKLKSNINMNIFVAIASILVTLIVLLLNPTTSMLAVAMPLTVFFLGTVARTCKNLLIRFNKRKALKEYQKNHRREDVLGEIKLLQLERDIISSDLMVSKEKLSDLENIIEQIGKLIQELDYQIQTFEYAQSLAAYKLRLDPSDKSLNRFYYKDPIVQNTIKRERKKENDN